MKPFPTEKMYLPSNSLCRLEHNYKSQKTLNFEPPPFLSTSESLKFKRLS